MKASIRGQPRLAGGALAYMAFMKSPTIGGNAMTYTQLKQLTAGYSLPLCGKNPDGENVIIEQGNADGVGFYKLTTAQRNNWNRINIIYADSTTEEYFQKR